MVTHIKTILVNSKANDKDNKNAISEVEQLSFLAKLNDGHKLSDNGEFDPGSGRTLAACFIHASRTRSSLR